MCDHPLEDKWAERPAVEVFSVYWLRGRMVLDPDGHNPAGDITVHCSSCGDVQPMHPKDIV